MQIRELTRRSKTQAPPPWVLWEALCDPWRPHGRQWFDIRPGEVAPTVLEEQKPQVVVWTSIWSHQPDLRIRFEIEAADGGSLVTWTLLGPHGRLDEDDVRRRRYRVDQLINGQLREAFDQ